MSALIFRSDPKRSPTDSPGSSNQIENLADPGVPDAGPSRTTASASIVNQCLRMKKVSVVWK